jgi:hypothetical protein
MADTVTLTLKSKRRWWFGIAYHLAIYGATLGLISCETAATLLVRYGLKIGVSADER